MKYYCTSKVPRNNKLLGSVQKKLRKSIKILKQYNELSKNESEAKRFVAYVILTILFIYMFK